MNIFIYYDIFYNEEYGHWKNLEYNIKKSIQQKNYKYLHLKKQTNLTILFNSIKRKFKKIVFYLYFLTPINKIINIIDLCHQYPNIIFLITYLPPNENTIELDINYFRNTYNHNNLYLLVDTNTLYDKFKSSLKKHNIIQQFPPLIPQFNMNSSNNHYDILYITDRSLDSNIITKIINFTKKNNIKLYIKKKYNSNYKYNCNTNTDIQICKNFVKKDNYYNILANSNIILIDYIQKPYYYRSSGVFIEAIYFKKILIVADNTWMSDNLYEYSAGITYEKNNINSILCAINYVINNNQILKKQINLKYKHFLDEFNFYDNIFNVIEQHTLITTIKNTNITNKNKIVHNKKIDEIDLIYRFFKTIHNKNKIMFDIGAMNGCSCKKFLADNWTVYAFEPNPGQRCFLEKYKQNNDKLIIEKYAVSNKEIKTNFYLSDISKGISSLTPFHKSHYKSIIVDTIRLDNYIKKRNVTQINFLKIDAEAEDYNILQSYPWDQYNPDIILCEFEDRKTQYFLNYTWQDMVNYLIEKKYNIIISEWFPIIEYGNNHQWNKFKFYPCNLDSNDAWGNIIAIKKIEHFNVFKNYINSLKIK